MGSTPPHLHSLHGNGEAERWTQQSPRRREPAATKYLPQKLPISGMSFTQTQGHRCLGHTEVPDHMMTWANPILTGNFREAAPEQRL